MSLKKDQLNTKIETKKATRHTENKKMAITNPSLSVVTLKLNGLNSPIKRHMS